EDQRAERGNRCSVEEARRAELVMDRIPDVVREEAEPEGRDRQPRTLDHLPRDQAYEDQEAEGGEPGDSLQDQIAKTHPPPREGAAGCVGAYVERGHDCSRFSPTTSGSS